MNQIGDLDERVGYTLKQVDAQLRKNMDDALRPLGLTVSQYACLEVLRRHRECSSAELARATFVSRQSMTVMLATMTRNGWVELTPDPPKGRAQPYRLTPEGQQTLAPASDAVQQIETRLIRGLSEPDQAALLSLLRACLANLR